MLRCQTELGLVAFYDIRSWNRAGLFLQPRSSVFSINKNDNKDKTIMKLKW